MQHESTFQTVRFQWYCCSSLHCPMPPSAMAHQAALFPLWYPQVALAWTLPFGNQTWLASKSHNNGGLYIVTAGEIHLSRNVDYNHLQTAGLGDAPKAPFYLLIPNFRLLQNALPELGLVGLTSYVERNRPQPSRLICWCYFAGVVLPWLEAWNAGMSALVEFCVYIWNQSIKGSAGNDETQTSIYQLLLWSEIAPQSRLDMLKTKQWPQSGLWQS